jgi:hypothetical protein
MKACGTWKRWAAASSLLWLVVASLHAGAQPSTQAGTQLGTQPGARVEAQATAEDVLAALVHQSAAIFAGEVYAIRVPQSANSPSSAGMASSRPDAVEVEFRVDIGIRGTSIGSNYILRIPVADWQASSPPFTLHQRTVTFLRPVNASGLSGPVQGEADLPGLDLGVMPVDTSNQVDLTRLQRLVAKKTLTAATVPAAPSGAPQAPSVTDVTTAQGQETLVSGSNQGRMPELRNGTVPFLALIRDVSVLTGAETPSGAAPGGAK